MKPVVVYRAIAPVWTLSTSSTMRLALAGPGRFAGIFDQSAAQTLAAMFAEYADALQHSTPPCDLLRRDQRLHEVRHIREIAGIEWIGD